MATYAIGDLQGCYDELRRLLDRLQFDPHSDRLWFTGDLVNRGPKSLECLRFVKSLGGSSVTVLGNHDLHLLAVWRNRQRYVKPTDTLRALLDADDAEELLEWLRRQPLLHHDAGLGYLLVHAGLPPQWDLHKALQCAHEVEAVLRGARLDDFLENMYGDEPNRWSESLTGWERLRFSVNCFTRLRFCTLQGELEFTQKGAPGGQRQPFLPWFDIPGRKTRDIPVVFGHWSTLGFHQGENVYGLDSGCLWGGTLTALRLDDPNTPAVHVGCEGALTPGEN